MTSNGAVSIVNPSSMFPIKSGETKRPNYVSAEGPIQTNNFYTNLLLDNHDNPVWTNPYKLTFDSTKCNIYYPVSSDIVYGSDPVKYYFFPNGINHLLLTSTDFSESPTFTIPSLSKFVAHPKFSNTYGTLSMPLVQGMGFVTGIYKGLIPEIITDVGFKNITGVSCQNDKLSKFVITLQNDVKYTMFTSEIINIKYEATRIIFPKSYDNLYVQVAYGTNDYYDQVAGCYIDEVEFKLNDKSYLFEYKTIGSSLTSCLVFCPPHMVNNFNQDTKSKISNISVDSHVLGSLTGCITDKVTVNVTTPDISFSFNSETFDETIKAHILKQAQADCKADVNSETNLDSMYFAGKKFLKFAYLLYLVHFVLKEDLLTRSLLERIKSAYSRFINNEQKNPLFYDSEFLGIVSSATGGNDFGNGHYNDHHFHYGYHVHASALIIKVEQDLGQLEFSNSVKSWIEYLIKDFFNTDESNNEFPLMRSFDFYFGHSWAKGLYVSGDGKDEESSSEDYNSFYGIKLYGEVTGNTDMTRKSNCILGIMQQSFNHYFYYLNNTIMPSKFTSNIVSGIYFENKVDHTTYFGNFESYIHGIHMIPLTPLSQFFRSKEFVSLEWEHIKDQLTDDNWMSTCMMNYSLIDGSGAYNFFSNQWQDKYLDDGLSLSFCLFYCASNM